MKSTNTMYIFRNQKGVLVYIFSEDENGLKRSSSEFGDYYDNNSRKFSPITKIEHISTDRMARYDFAARFRTFENIKQYQQDLTPISKEEVLEVYRKIKLYPLLRGLAETWLDIKIGAKDGFTC